MSEIVSFPVGAGESVLVEVDLDQPQIGPASRAGDVIRSAATSFDGALANVRTAASMALENFRDMDVSPDEIELEFGLKLNAQAGAVIAKSSIDGHVRVTLTWRRSKHEATDHDGS